MIVAESQPMNLLPSQEIGFNVLGSPPLIPESQAQHNEKIEEHKYVIDGRQLIPAYLFLLKHKTCHEVTKTQSIHMISWSISKI